MSQALTTRFFPSSRTVVDPSQPDDPDPVRTRDFVPITADEIRDALSQTSNSSAPGLSGVNYKLLKWAFAASPDRFVDLFNGCVTFGHHPWTAARVVPIAKPKKADYSLPKAYRPISLLECCGKLLEKIMAKRVLSDLNEFSLLPPSQFGSRDGHCAVDAALSLVHTAQQGIRSKHPVAVILLDIQGFFDNVRRDRVVHLFRLLGFPDPVCDWVSSFLSDRTVALSFNEFLGAASPVSDGTPQGSPLSPILSAIYTFPLLRIAERWSHSSLQLYVDDGAVVASGATYRNAAGRAAQAYERVTDWLRRCGLSTDPDKLEFIMFFNPRCHSERLYGTPVSRLGLRDAVHGELSVQAATSVRYLGIFLTHKLTWDVHVRTMCNRARATVRALHLLGNSIRGLDYANWRRVFHAIVLPTLTYGAPIWYSHQGARDALVKMAQVAQNDAIRRIAGCFHTTPVLPLHHLMAILPIHYTLGKLRASFTDRLTRLSPSHLLRTLPHSNSAAIWPAHSSPPSTLINLSPSFFPPYFAPRQPYALSWSHPSVVPLSSSAPTQAARDFSHTLLHNLPPSDLSLMIQHLPLPEPGFVSAFLLLRGKVVIDKGWRRHATSVGALLTALLGGLRAALSAPSGDLHVFVPNRAIGPYVFNLSKSPYLPLSSQITGCLSKYVEFSIARVDLLWYSTKWVRLPGSGADGAFAEIRNSVQQSMAAAPPLPLSRKEEAFGLWRQDSIHLPRVPHSAWASCEPPDGNKPPSYVRGLLACHNRRYMSAGIQLTNRHCFDADYSYNFRPKAGDETMCPCNYTPVSADDTADTVPSRDRPCDDSADGSPSRNCPPGILPFGRILPHTVLHILTACPLTSHLRATILLNCSLPMIFGTELGASRLCRFLHFSQLLLRPLPPRPDPP